MRSQQLDLASSSFFLSFLFFFFFFSAQNPALRVWRLQGRRASVQGVSRARDCAASEVSLSPSGRKVRGSMSPISGFVQRHFHVCVGFFLTLHTLFEKKNKKLSLLTVWRWQWRLDDGGACESSHHSQPSVAPRLLSIMWARLKKGGKQTRFYCLIIHTRTKKDFWLINTIISQGSLNRACMKEENLSGEWSLFTWKPADSAVLTTEPRPAKGHKLMVRTRAATLSCDPGILWDFGATTWPQTDMTLDTFQPKRAIVYP